MIRIFVFLSALIFLNSILLSQPQSEYKINPVHLSLVKFTNGFWHTRFETNRDVTIPHLFEQIKKSGREDNLIYAAGIKDGIYCTRYPFDESDIFKSIEAASYILLFENNPGLEAKIDSIIMLISRVQREDGYLYSARNVPSEKIKQTIGPERWSNLQWSHELYNIGHLYEAAVAHYQATGKRTLLNVAIKNAELILSEFGPNGLNIPPGHQEIEIGLVKLYELTDEKKYLDLAKNFLNIRGRGEELSGRTSWGEYAQDHLPPINQTEAVGHAVRAVYMYSSMVDMAVLSEDASYEKAINNLWENVAGKKLYLTGGIGSTGSGESFGDEYDLPNASAYNETCSSIANMLWNFRMFRMYGDAKYLDIFERTLYNSFLSGVGIEGNLFFYPNPLVSYGTQSRAPWFTCACCPPNIARFITSLPSKIYSTSKDRIYVNIYSSNTAEIEFGKKRIKIEQVTDYPWDGKITLRINPANTSEIFTLNLRIPGWTSGKPLATDLYKFLESGDSPVISINGKVQEYEIKKGFIPITRAWNANDRIELHLPMKIHRIVSNEKVVANRGKVALQRGPIIFCMEWIDNQQELVDNIFLSDDAELFSHYDTSLLNGINVLQGKAFSYYYNKEGKIFKRKIEFKLIPYYAWAHRGVGEMSVWFARDEGVIKPRNGPTLASTSKISVSSGKVPQALNDQIEPENSEDRQIPFFQWWPKQGIEDWVQIDFPENKEVSMVEIYWFEDEKSDRLRLPQSWKVMYKTGATWQEVYPTQPYNIKKDQYSEVIFETVRTNALKIFVQSPENFAVGIHELKIK